MLDVGGGSEGVGAHVLGALAGHHEACGVLDATGDVVHKGAVVRLSVERVLGARDLEAALAGADGLRGGHDGACTVGHSRSVGGAGLDCGGAGVELGGRCGALLGVLQLVDLGGQLFEGELRVLVSELVLNCVAALCERSGVGGAVLLHGPLLKLHFRSFLRG